MSSLWLQTEGWVTCCGLLFIHEVYKLDASQETVDFTFLNSYERGRSQALLAKVESLKYSVDVDEITRWVSFSLSWPYSSFLSDKVMQIASFKFLNEFKLPPYTFLPPTGFPYDRLANTSCPLSSSVTLSPHDPTLYVTAVLEPLTLATQKASSLLLFLVDHFSVNLKIFLKYKAEDTIQLKNYYRYVLVCPLSNLFSLCWLSGTFGFQRGWIAAPKCRR